MSADAPPGAFQDPADVSGLDVGEPIVRGLGRGVIGGTSIVRCGPRLRMTARSNGGIIRRNIELDDDKLGTVASMELDPAKARMLLQLALLKTKDPKVIQGFLDRY